MLVLCVFPPRRPPMEQRCYLVVEIVVPWRGRRARHNLNVKLDEAAYNPPLYDSPVLQI